MKRTRRLTLTAIASVLLLVLALITESQQCRGGHDATAAEKRTLAVHPFQLGHKVVFPAEGEPPTGLHVRDLLFTVEARPPRFRETALGPGLRAEITLSGLAGQPLRDEQLLLVLYDDAGRPLQSLQAPLAVTDVLDRPAAKLFEDIRARSGLWLSPDAAKLPDLTYTFYCGDQPEQCSLRDKRNSHLQRGVTLTLGLDSLLSQPERYKAPIAFGGKWDDKEVLVVAVTGPPFGLAWGNGITHTWHGYRVDMPSSGWLVLEKSTLRPLVSRYNQTEIHFLEYVETSSGQQTPLRIVMFDGDSRYDFRFQIVDGRVWLFDQSFDAAGKLVAHVDQVLIDGKPVTATKPAESLPAAKELKSLDWSQITERRTAESNEPSLVREIVATSRPWEHPAFTVLTELEPVIKAPSDGWLLTFKLGQSAVLKRAKHWTLSRLGSQRAGTGDARPAALSRNLLGAEKLVVDTYPAELDRPLAVVVPDGRSGKTHLRGMRLVREADGQTTGQPELVSQDHNTELATVVGAILLDADDIPVAADTVSSIFRVEQGVYRSGEQSLHFGRCGQPFLRCGLGVATTVIGEPMGSTWGRYADFSPLFSFAQFLEGNDPRVWKVGIQELNHHLRQRIIPHETRHVSDAFVVRNGLTRRQSLAPHVARIEVLLGKLQDAEALALLCRLAGHTGDKQLVKRLLPLLNDPRPEVQDAAAIGLGLLGDPRGADRLPAILNQRLPEDYPSRQTVKQLIEDAKQASLAIRPDPFDRRADDQPR
jgi:hypothetical protein